VGKATALNKLVSRVRGTWRRSRLWPRSLRWRLQVWHGFLLVCLLTGFAVTVYQLQRLNRIRQIDADLETHVTALTKAVRETYRDGRGPSGPPPDRPALPKDGNYPSPNFAPSAGLRKGRRDGPPPDGPPPDGGLGIPGGGRHPPPDGPSPDGGFGRPEGGSYPKSDAARSGGPPDGGPPPDGPPPNGGSGFPGSGRHPPPDAGRSGGPPGGGPPPDGPPPNGGFGRSDGGRYPESEAAQSLDHPPDGGPRPHGPKPPNKSTQRSGRGPTAPPPPPLREVTLPSETAGLFPGASGHYFTIWDRDGRVLNRSANAPLDSRPPAASERDTVPHFRTHGLFREAVHCSGLGDCAMAGRSIETDLEASWHLGWTLSAAATILLSFGLGLGWWLISRAISPVDQISTSATRVAAGNLSERIKIADPDDELGRLATVLNATFARLESAFARQKQFTSDAAHELRTPLAILISESQTTLARERTAAEYRETVEANLEIAQQMRRLTLTLLELARFDAADAQVRRETINLADVAARCIERLSQTASQKGITIHPDLTPAFSFTAAERLELVALNLLANAIYYNVPEGIVRVATYNEDGMAVLAVADTGIGIAREDLPHIFDRFFRADKARSNAEDHSGLGLAICKTIIDAERGTIDVLSTPQAGTTFIVRLTASQGEVTGTRTAELQ
jgi:two-component system, OmpR family, sensor kinase